MTKIKKKIIRKTELAAFMAASLGITHAEALKMTGLLFSEMKLHLEQGNEVSISGFGKFIAEEQEARVVKGFGKEHSVPATMRVRFRMSKAWLGRGQKQAAVRTITDFERMYAKKDDI